MKKVFACLSAVLLMLVAFGLVMQPAKVSAVEVEEGKFIVDPTLEEGDIPIYCMNSIRTSFPRLYDYNAQPDANYNVGRDYYWNEIKLMVPLFDEDGATGQRYAVYTVGAYDTSLKTAAGSKIYLWAVDSSDGQIKTATQTRSSVNFSGQYAPLFGDVSLSGVRYNVSGQDIPVQNLYNENGIVNGDHQTDPIYVLFNGEGKAVRGAFHDNYFAAENISTYGFTPLFGYKDGKLVLRTDVVAGSVVNGFGATDAELDREQLEVPNPEDPVLDPVTGEPMYDEATGEPLYNTMLVDGEEAKILTGQRYIWQWVSEEEFDPEVVNSVQYLEEGWMYTKWDYAYADPNGGYLLLAFAPSLGKFAVLTDQQSEVHNASVRAALEAGELTEEVAAELLLTETVEVDEETQVETIKYQYKERPVIVSLVIPEGGISYRFGYLDYAGNAVVDLHFGKFCKLNESAMLYGRHSDYQAYARTYNFSATGLVAKSVVYDNTSFILREENGKLIYEIKEGTKLSPKDIIDITGMLGGFSVSGKPATTAGSNVAAVQSYKNASVSELEYDLEIGEEPLMKPVVHKYSKWDDLVQDFLKDFATQVYGNPSRFVNAETGKQDPTVWADLTYGVDVTKTLAFFQQDDWKFLGDAVDALVDAEGDSYKGPAAGTSNYYRFNLKAILNKTLHSSWPYSIDCTNNETYQAEILDASPEIEYKFNTFAEFVQSFMLAFATEVYDNPTRFVDEETGLQNPLVWADLTYGVNVDKTLAFFATDEWSFVGALIDSLVAAEGDSYKGPAAGTSNYYRWNLYAILNKTVAGSWPYSVNCTNLEDPEWIGKILEKDWNKISFETEGYEAFDVIPLVLTVNNKATGFSNTLRLEFHVVREFTPIIKVDESLLTLRNGQSLDLASAVKAYDGVYRGGSVYGSDITRQYVEFELPEGFDVTSPAAGTHYIKITAKCPNELGLTTTQVIKVTVMDVTAPKVLLSTKEVHVLAGDELDINKILVYAYDDVEGDLLRSASVDYKWYTISTDYDPLEASVGEEFEAVLTVTDSTGNITQVKFTIIATGTSAEFDDAKLDDILDLLQNGSTTDDGTTSAVSCGNAGFIVAGVLAAAGLAAVILRKKH